MRPARAVLASAALSLLGLLALPRSGLSWPGLPRYHEADGTAVAAAAAPALATLVPSPLPQQSRAQEEGSGQGRARSWRTCNMTYRTTPKKALYLVSDALKLTYVLMSKSGSSTIRDTIRCRDAGMPNWNYTVFTVVRDPLERVVSFFFYANMHTYAKLSPEQALPLFDEVTAKLVHKQDGHAHGQRSVPLPAGHSYDFVGTLATLAADWARLGELQRQRFGIVEWPPLARRSRDRGQRYRTVLNVTSLTVNLSQRICNIYRDDYCCFQLPVPPACRVDCAGGLPADPPQQIRGPR